MGGKSLKKKSTHVQKYGLVKKKITQKLSQWKSTQGTPKRATVMMITL